MKHVMNNFFTAKSFTALTLCSLFFTCLTFEVLAAPRAAIPKKERVVVENKANQFNQVLSSTNESSKDTSANDLADKIRKQREAIEARENASLVQSNQQMALKNGQNACDSGLRQCMQKTCGNDFTKCSLDGDTILGDKFNKCKRDTKCTTEEFNLFIKEIKADMELNVQLASYNAVIECGNKYNACIQKECGDTFGKCLGKKYEDRATQACESIAKNCREQDSGLAARFGVVAGRLREDAEKDIKADEERMYKLRDLMRGQCEKLGAMFDERSFDCVYTVNFFAGENQSKPMASRKAYAGSSFTCMQEWFGVNVTTYKENAYRETRAQTAASSAMLGSGVGTAVGLVTSGAIGRALDTQKAKKDLKSECESQGGTLKNGECKAKDGKKIDIDEDKGDKDNPEEKPEDSKDDDESGNGIKNRKDCKAQGGKWKMLKRKCILPDDPNFATETDDPEDGNTATTAKVTEIERALKSNSLLNASISFSKAEGDIPEISQVLQRWMDKCKAGTSDLVKSADLKETLNGDTYTWKCEATACKDTQNYELVNGQCEMKADTVKNLINNISLPGGRKPVARK